MAVKQAVGKTMTAVLLDAPGQPLRAATVPVPQPRAGQVFLRVRACGVCRTDLHIADGELPRPKLPLVLGHEIVGTVVDAGEGTERFAAGSRVGVPWLGATCGRCRYCRTGRENLCDDARFTGYQLDGGYAECTVADERFCFPIPEGYPDRQAAPLLCAGLIGYRAYTLAGDAPRLGLYGFGAAAHLRRSALQATDFEELAEGVRVDFHAAHEAPGDQPGERPRAVGVRLPGHGVAPSTPVPIPEETP